MCIFGNMLHADSDRQTECRRMSWPGRQEGPAGCLRLLGLHEYETLFEYLHRLLRSTRGWASGFKLECWRLVTAGPPVAKIEPAVVQIKRHTKFVTVAWYRGSMPPPAPGLGNDWDALADDVMADAGPVAIAPGGAMDDDDDGPLLGDLSAEEDGLASAGDGFGSEVESEFLMDDDLFRAAAFSSDDDDDMVPPVPVAASSGAALAEARHAVAAAEPHAPMEVEGAAELADAADGDDDVPPVPEPFAGGRVAAYRAAGVKNGTIRAYCDKSMRMVASCSVHGERECRLTRSLLGSGLPSRSGQGRPLGLMVAWLACAGDHPDAGAHKGMKPLPSFADRQKARADFFAEDEERSVWMDGIERPVREDEGEEPERVP